MYGINNCDTATAIPFSILPLLCAAFLRSLVFITGWWISLINYICCLSLSTRSKLRRAECLLVHLSLPRYAKGCKWVFLECGCEQPHFCLPLSWSNRTNLLHGPPLFWPLPFPSEVARNRNLLITPLLSFTLCVFGTQDVFVALKIHCLACLVQTFCQYIHTTCILLWLCFHSTHCFRS